MRSFQLRLIAVAIAVCFLWPTLARSVRAAQESTPDEIASFRKAMQRILSQPDPAKSNWGILVVDEATGKTLYQHNATHYFTPASNVKLITTALALEELGPNYRWRTTIESPGQVDSDGTLDGDLVLVGRGDPNLSNLILPFGENAEFDGPRERVLAELADQVVAKGVKRIRGDVVADNTYFTYERYPPGWAIDDMATDYGEPVSAIVVDDNALEVVVSPGARPGDAVSFQVLPWTGFYHFENEATTGRVRSVTTLHLHKEPDSHEVRLTGSIAAGAPPMKLYIGIEEPARYAAALMKRLLVERGVSVSGTTRALNLRPDQTPPAVARQVLAEHESPTLAEDVRYVLKVSQNLHAECLLRTVAHVKTGVGSAKNGLQVEQEFLRRLGIADDVLIFDGSGLSAYDAVTPRAMVTLLRYVGKQSWGAMYKDALPVAGRDGTLDGRMEQMAAKGRVFAKTGTLAYDRSLSGYATTVGGEHLVFSILANNIPPRVKLNPYLDMIANAMVEDLGRARRTQKRPRR